MAGCGNFLVGGQLQVTAGLPGGIPGPPATALGGGAGTPPVNGSAWVEGPMLIGSPISYPLPRPAATLMIGRTKNYLAPEAASGLPMIMITSRGFSPTPTDLLVGDPSGPVGLTATLAPKVTVTVLGKTNYTAPKTTAFGKLDWTGKVNITGKTSFTGKSVTTGKKVVNGNMAVNGRLVVSGNISSPTIEALKIKISTKKGFDIPHPTKQDHRLRYICIEGPAAEVYFRGKLNGSNIIDLPDYWKNLVDIETIGVSLTPFEVYQELLVDKIEWGSRIIIKNNLGGPINCSFVVFAERKDTPKNIAEYQGLTPNDYPGDNREYTINGG
jgi:hypothetical protein